jgi:hypothetical protein
MQEDARQGGWLLGGRRRVAKAANWRRAAHLMDKPYLDKSRSQTTLRSGDARAVVSTDEPGPAWEIKDL